MQASSQKRLICAKKLLGGRNDEARAQFGWAPASLSCELMTVGLRALRSNGFCLCAVARHDAPEQDRSKLFLGS